MKSPLVLCVIVLLALFASGCGSDDAAVAALDAVTDVGSGANNTPADDAEPADDSAEDTPADDAEPADDSAEDTPADDAEPADESAEDTPADDAEPADESADDVDETMATDDTMVDEVKTPQRIISLNPTATEMLFAIGAGDQVVAVDEYSYFPEDAPVTDLSGYVPNIEAIAGFEPDLVVTDVPLEGLDAIGVANHIVPAATNLDNIYTQMEQLGALTGHVAEAAELVGQMQTDIEAVLASLPDRETPLTYYHEVDNTLYSVTSTTFIGYVYDVLGLVNVADPADADGSAYGYPQLNEEFLIDADPDIIFLADTLCCGQNAETIAARPGWDQLTAVKNGNIVELNDDIVSRWGPRIVEFMQVAGAAVAELEAVPAS